MGLQVTPILAELQQKLLVESDDTYASVSLEHMLSLFQVNIHYQVTHQYRYQQKITREVEWGHW